MTPEQLATALAGLKEDLNKSFEEKLTAQQTQFEEKLKPVNDIQATLEQARKNQAEAQERQRQAEAAKGQQGWKPSTWDDIPALVDKRAGEIAQKTLEARDQAIQQREQKRLDEEAELERQLDNSLIQLERSGYLPPVGNPNDYNDPGVAARRELMSAAEHMSTMELDKVADTLSELHRNNMVFDSSTKRYISAEDSLTPLPGKYAPVGNSSVSAPSTSFAGPTAAELRGSSMDDLIALAERRGYGPAPRNTPQDPGF
jgi:multidrug efflux pump subunit AcrA (membrane-fusion protein)